MTVAGSASDSAAGGRYSIVFDGGSINNPGRGYGTYRLRRDVEPWGDPVALEFGGGVTSNEAEYRTLITALEGLADRCEDAGSVAVTVIGDSRLVLNQVQGTWKVKAANLRPLVASARRAARRFGEVRYVWQGREESVKLLGH